MPACVPPYRFGEGAKDLVLDVVLWPRLQDHCTRPIRENPAHRHQKQSARFCRRLRNWSELPIPRSLDVQPLLQLSACWRGAMVIGRAGNDNQLHVLRLHARHLQSLPGSILGRTAMSIQIPGLRIDGEMS
jgi:hypothetical protein